MLEIPGPRAKIGVTPSSTTLHVMSRVRPWIARRGGLHFRCTQCGRCCTQPGYVSITREEAARIAARLVEGGTPKDLQGSLWDWDDQSGTWMIDVPEAAACPLLGEQGCVVHDIKPEQCATYPFWSENLASRTVWKNEAKFCEGIREEGDLYTPELIDVILQGKRLTNENHSED